MTQGSGNHNGSRSKLFRQVLGSFFPRTNQVEADSNGTSSYPESQMAALIRQDRATWERALRAAKHGPRVLIPTAIGGHQPSTTFEAFLAVALTLRGANVEFLLCDHQLPACLMCNHSSFDDPAELVRDGPQRICNWCYPAGRAMYKPLGLPIRTLGESLTDAQRTRAHEIATRLPLEEIPTFTFDGLEIGAHVMAGAVRFFVNGDLTDEPLAEPLLRRYLEAALLSAVSIRGLLANSRYKVAVFHHGIYVPQGIFGEVFRQAGVRVVNWGPAYRKHCFLFSHHFSHHFTLLQEPVSLWENMTWSDTTERELMDYVSSRWTGANDWIGVSPIHQPNDSDLAQEIGIDFSKPTVGLLTNVMWDAQLFYEGNAYRTMRDWLFDTISHFSQRPALQLLIRVHPAEVRGTLVSRQQIISEIKKRFPELPPNVFVIPPESNIDTYRAMMQCDSVLIFGTKTGMELATLEMPILVAGDAWIRDKGITLDAHSRAEYLELLERLPLKRRLDATTTQRARKYAYHFFFRRMIPIHCVNQETTGWKSYTFAVDRLEDMLSEQEHGLDIICKGILDGTEFVYPAEQLSTVATAAGS